MSPKAIEAKLKKLKKIGDPVEIAHLNLIEAVLLNKTWEEVHNASDSYPK